MLALDDATAFGRTMNVFTTGHPSSWTLDDETKQQQPAPDAGSSRLMSYALALLVVSAAALLTLALWRLLESSPSLLFFPAVMAGALYFGLGPGLLASIAATCWLAFYFFPPYGAVKLASGDLMRLLVFSSTAVATAWLSTARRRAEEAHRRLASVLEKRVADRTADLEATNRALQREMAERARLEEQVRQAQRLEAVGRLAGGIAHDFNNLLTVIIGSADLLAEEIPQGTESRTLLVEVQKAAARAAVLTRQLLAYGRRQQLQPQAVSLNALVQDVLRMLRRLLPDRVSARADLDSRAARVFADPGQVEQVIMNLAVNAIDAMPDGGALTVSTRSVQLPGPNAGGSGGVPEGAYVRLSVADTGIGMDAITAARIFEPFFTTKPVGKGTGLGLSMVYGVVKQTGGHVTVDTAPGKGTTINVYLPVERSRQTGLTSPDAIHKL